MSPTERARVKWLTAPSSAAWLEAALADPDTLLLDHAHCERKAAGAALQLMFRYPSDADLARALSPLAREELEHFERVQALLERRGIPLKPLAAPPYGAGLAGRVRRQEPGRLLDSLLVAGLIEARSHERMALLAQRCADPELRTLWAELLARWMGYCLLGTRRYARWMLMYGKIRGGKGTISSVIRKLIGRAAFMSSSLEDLAGEFGMDGLERSKVLSINEVNEVDSKAGERVCRVLKNIVGQDPMTVNVKHQRQQRNVIVNAAPMLQSNEIPVLPNKGRGLSGKMLVLPFEVSFEGKEDLCLEDRLEAELQGIAMWAAWGARRLLASEMDKRWPVPAAAQDAVRLYHLQNNPFDSFLHARFVQRKDGFVANEVVKDQWEDWLESNRVRLHVPANMLFVRICQESSWGLRQMRMSESQGHQRGICGLSLRRNQEDEV